MENEGNQSTCACDCGKVTSGANLYVRGHYLGNGRKPYQDEKSTNLGTCKCRCGNPIPRTPKALAKYRAGRPSQFIRGHVSHTPGFPKPPVRYGPDNNRWTDGSSSKQHYDTKLVIVDAPIQHVDNAKMCGCGCSWLTYLSANEPDPPFVHGHHLFISAVPDDGYCALHGWLRHTYRKNGSCDKCGSFTKPTEFSLIHGRSYTKNREDYRELCKGCHMKYDRPAMKYVTLVDQKSIIERYNSRNLYVRKTDSIRQLTIDFNVTSEYVKTLVNTTRISALSDWRWCHMTNHKLILHGNLPPFCTYRIWPTMRHMAATLRISRIRSSGQLVQ